MSQFLEEYTLQSKQKIFAEQGQHTLAFCDGKFVEFVTKCKMYPEKTKIVIIPSTSIKLLWGTREKLTFICNNEFLHIGLSGSVQIQIINPRKFYNDVLISNKSLTADQLQSMVVPVIVNFLDIYGKQYVSENRLNILQLESFKAELARNARIVLPEPTSPCINLCIA